MGEWRLLGERMESGSFDRSVICMIRGGAVGMYSTYPPDIKNVRPWGFIFII